jgi:hypothetical protein
MLAVVTGERVSKFNFDKKSPLDDNNPEPLEQPAIPAKLAITNKAALRLEEEWGALSMDYLSGCSLSISQISFDEEATNRFSKKWMNTVNFTW